ncbi:hypothetical protein [Leucobacter sp. GX24907]
MDTPRSHRGLVLAAVTGVLALFGFVITLMPRTDPSLWGAVLVVGTLGPIGGLILATLAGAALNRATDRPARIVAVVSIVLSIAGLFSALSLWGL